MFVSTISRQCSGVSARKPRAAPKPAFANTASSRPKAAMAAAAMCCCSSQSVTSQRTASARSGPPSSSASARRRSCERAASTTRHPAAEAARAVAAPMPDEAPVISRTRSAGWVVWLLIVACSFARDGMTGRIHIPRAPAGGRRAAVRMWLMLQDRARIHVTAGAGGDGCVSFRREAHVPRGGPDGGDGGRGGAVTVVCDDALRDLQSVARRTHYAAGRGGNGAGSLRHGANGQDLPIAVPPGTEIALRDEVGGRAGRRWELLAPGQRATVARGGTGGRGNKHFASATRQAPRFAERGLPGEEGWLELRLRLLA